VSKINFKITNYTLAEDSERKQIIIEGQKLPPPSKRITLYQPTIKVLSAKIIYKHKKGDIEYEVCRVNRLKSFGEVRLHTNTTMYPGSYIITIEYNGALNESNLKNEPL
jgi:hypothetical protein